MFLQSSPTSIHQSLPTTAVLCQNLFLYAEFVISVSVSPHEISTCGTWPFLQRMQQFLWIWRRFMQPCVCLSYENLCWEQGYHVVGLIHAHFVAYHCIVCLTTKNIWTTMTLAHPPTVIFVEKCSSCQANWKITWNHCMRKSFFHLQTTYCGSLLLKFLPSPSSQRDFLVHSVNIPSMTLENT